MEETIFFILDFITIVVVIGIVALPIYLHINAKKKVFFDITKEQFQEKVKNKSNQDKNV